MMSFPCKIAASKSWQRKVWKDVLCEPDVVIRIWLLKCNAVRREYHRGLCRSFFKDLGEQKHHFSSKFLNVGTLENGELTVGANPCCPSLTSVSATL